VKFLQSKKSKGCQLIYSLTTPYPSKEPGQKLDPVKNQVVMDRNRIARKIMEENDIPVIDLYGLMEPELEKYSGSKGNVHYNNEGYERLAKQISNEILKRIQK
jgi:lysophospholipase L1-like esterase